MSKLISFLTLLAVMSSYSMVAQRVQSQAVFEYQNGYWVLEIKAPNQLALQELEGAYPLKEPSKMSVSEYHALYQSHLLNSIFISLDSVDLPMNLVAIELNSAKANGKFISTRMDHPGNEFSVRINSFSEITDHSTQLTIKNGAVIKKATLTKENDFSVELSLID